MFIGKSNWPNDPMFKGMMSDLFIWDTALTQSQLTNVRLGKALPAAAQPLVAMFRTWCDGNRW